MPRVTVPAYDTYIDFPDNTPEEIMLQVVSEKFPSTIEPKPEPRIGKWASTGVPTVHAGTKKNFGPTVSAIDYAGFAGLPNQSLTIRKRLADLIRPTAEGLGAVGGAALGTSLGGMTGPAAPVAAPILGVAGAGMGYQSAKNLVDILGGTPETTAKGVLSDIGTGSMYEMGGQILPKIGGTVFQSLKNLSRSSRIEKAAGHTLESAASKGPIYEKAAEEAAIIERAIPGYKATLGERTDSPSLLRLQRTMSRSSQIPGAAEKELEHRAANTKAVRDYLDDAFRGNASLDDAIAVLQKRQAEVETKLETAKAGQAKTRTALVKALERQRNNVELALAKATDAKILAEKALPAASELQSSGRGVVDTIEAARIPAKQAVENLYNALPNEKLKTPKTKSVVAELKKDFRPGDEEVFPSRAISRIEEALKTKGAPRRLAGFIQAAPSPVNEITEVGFQNLHSLRKDIGRQIRDASTGAKPNRELAMKLERLKNAIDSDIEAGMQASNQYQEARNAYRDYVGKFRKGSVEEVLRRGNQFSGRNLPDALIGKKVFTPDGADQFIRAVGPEKATAAIRGYAANDLKGMGELSSAKLAAWLQRNGATLEKYGLKKNFDNLSAAATSLEEAAHAQNQFNKSVAAKILNMEPDKAIEIAMHDPALERYGVKGQAATYNKAQGVFNDAQKAQQQFGRSSTAKILNADKQNFFPVAMQGGEGLSAKSTGRIMRRLMSQIGNDPKALAGLRVGFKDFMINKIETTAKNLGESTLSPASFQKLMKQYEPAMRVLYSGKENQKQLQALLNAQKAVEISSRSIASRLGGGSDTAENVSALLRLSKVAGHIPGLGNPTRIIIAGMEKVLSLRSEDINRLVLEAMYNPEFAQTLRAAARSKEKDVMAAKIQAQIATLGLISGGNLRRDSQ